MFDGIGQRPPRVSRVPGLWPSGNTCIVQCIVGLYLGAHKRVEMSTYARLVGTFGGHLILPAFTVYVGHLIFHCICTYCV